MLFSTLALLSGCASQTAKPVESKAVAFWPTFPDAPHVQFLTSYASTSDINTRSNKLEEIIYGKEDEQKLTFNKPYGVRLFQQKIYVCDTNNATLTVLDLVKHESRLIGTSGEGKLLTPVDVCVAPDGMIYVADSKRPAVYVFDQNEKFIRVIGEPKSRPVGVAVFGDRLYVADIFNHKISVIDRHTGNILSKIGTPGQAKGQLGGPLGVAVDKQGNIYVTEVMNCRIQKFSPEGKSLRCYGERGDAPGSFTRPKHLAVDSEGTIYVTDAAFQNVQMFDMNFRGLMYFGGSGNYPGYMELPAGISICEDPADMELYKQFVHPAFEMQRLVIVTNQWGENRVAIYAMGKLKPGKTTNDIAASRNVVTNPATQPTSRPFLNPVTPGGAVPKDLKSDSDQH